MKPSVLDADIALRLAAIVGSGNILTDDEARGIYGKDETEDLGFPPDIIVKTARQRSSPESLPKSFRKNSSAADCSIRQTPLQKGAATWVEISRNAQVDP